MRCWIAIGLLWSTTTLATETSSGVPPEFLTCYGISQTSERLACYDHAVEYLRRPSDGAAAPSAETSFGLQGNSGESRNSDATAEQNKQTSSVTARISDVDTGRDGLKTITLDNGQVWRQITGGNAVFLNPGDEVTVSRGALGSFMMRIPNGGPLRVRRVK
jgi:hypothetical protein